MKTYLVIFSFVIYYANCSPCTKVESVDITNGLHFDNGSVYHDGILYQTTTWYEVQEEGVRKLFGCPCIERLCVWKCCGSGTALFGRTCNNTDLSSVNPFSPPVFSGKEKLQVEAHQLFFYMYNRLCEGRYIVDTITKNEELYIQKNGTLYEVANGVELWHAPNRYCVEMRVNNASPAPRLMAAICDSEVTSDDSRLLYILYAIGLLLSVPFLLATFLVYALIPELRNLHGLCLMAYCAGLLLAYPCLAYLKLQSGLLTANRVACLVIAFTVYYAFQTSFFWLNVMCFDIWRAFRGHRGGSSYKRRETKRFACYAVYSWGTPLILVSITIAMQFSTGLPQNIIKPGFGDRRYWFENWMGELVYFYTPVLILVVCNTVFFSVTAYRIRSIRQETAILKGAESARSDKLKRDKQRYALYLKLFMVMGVNWMVELIGFAAGGSNWYWIVVDLSNIMLGFFIFVIFVWKNKVRNLISKRLGFGGPLTGLNDSSTSRWATRSTTANTEDTKVSNEESTTALRQKDER